MSEEDKLKETVIKDLVDFYRVYIYGDPLGKLTDAIRVNNIQKWFKDALGITELETNFNGMDYRISELRNQIQGIHNKQVGHIDIEHKEILNKEISELTKIVYDLIQDLHIGVLNSSGSWSLLLDRLKKLGGEKSLARVKERKAELTASLNMEEPCKPTTDSKPSKDKRDPFKVIVPKNFWEDYMKEGEIDFESENVKFVEIKTYCPYCKGFVMVRASISLNQILVEKEDLNRIVNNMQLLNSYVDHHTNSFAGDNLYIEIINILEKILGGT